MRHLPTAGLIGVKYFTKHVIIARVALGGSTYILINIRKTIYGHLNELFQTYF